jgi:hypothetical protein
VSTKYRPANQQLDHIEQALARTGGDITAACQQLPHVPARAIAAVWDRMQDAAWPTDLRARSDG